MFGSGADDILLARSDGSIEIYSYKSETEEVVLNSEISVNEGVTSLVAGSPQGFSEIILSTFSGKIIGLSDASKLPDFNLTSTLTSDISSLRQKLEESKKHYVPSVPSLSNNPSASPPKVTYKLSLMGEQAAYCLIIEAQVSISMLLIQAEIPIELLDNEEHEASISITEEESQTLVSYKYSDTAHTRSQLLFRNSEGQPGNINIYIIPSLEPKIATQITVEIKPLSLHEKVLNLITSDRPLNTIKLSGSFSKNEMHG